MTAQFVLIIEDDPTWQDIFAELIGDAGFDPVVVSSYEDALTALSARSYALAVVDISLSLPDHANRGGVEVLRKIVELPAKLPAIVVTGYATVDLAIETLVELDAVNFFRKEEFNRREFARIVKKETAAGDVLRHLSDREREVLTLMIQGQTNKEIAETLIVSVNTVKKHVQSIFTKLDVNTRAAAVARALGEEFGE